LRNAWYIGAWADEIGSEQPLPLRICNDPIVLFRDGMGRVAALADRCRHRAAPPHMGTVVEEGIQCGYHGLVINGSGRCVRVPGGSARSQASKSLCSCQRDLAARRFGGRIPGTGLSELGSQELDMRPFYSTEAALFRR
jgi:phenylpropionate dioxygenase-like ring-hydroxylating dioxygenase large terminal subunit